jgi:6,7-dimethyl-8-ribityllumazine synthase
MQSARRAPPKDQTDITGARALIVEARFYDDIQDALEGAVTELKAAGVTHDVIAARRAGDPGRDRDCDRRRREQRKTP